MRAVGRRTFLAALTGALVLWASPLAAQERPWEPGPSKLSSRDTRALEQLDEAGREALEAAVRERFASLAPATSATIERLCQGGLAPLSELPEQQPPAPLDVSALDRKKRKRVEAGSRPWRKLAESLAPEPPPRGVQASPVWERRVRYDDALGAIVRVDDDPLIPLRNALRGCHPDVDRAEALLRQRLDRAGVRRREARVLSHEYVDVERRSYQGIAFGDVLSRGTADELPEAEALLLVAEFRERDPGSLNRSALFVSGLPLIVNELARHRTVRDAVALAWLCPDPCLPHVDPPALEALQALLVMEDEDVARMEWRVTNVYFEMLGPIGVRTEVKTADLVRGAERRERMRAEAEAVLAAASELLHAR